MAGDTIYRTAYGDITIPAAIASKLGPHTIIGQPDKRHKTALRDARYFRMLSGCIKKKWIAGEI